MTLNLQATSVTRLRLYESAIVSRFVFSRKIRRPTTFDFCNTITPRTDIAPRWRVHALVCPKQQAGVAIGIEPITAVDRMRISAQHHGEAAEGCDQHEQSRA